MHVEACVIETKMGIYRYQSSRGSFKLPKVRILFTIAKCKYEEDIHLTTKVLVSMAFI